jgi:hypothetical protein
MRRFAHNLRRESIFSYFFARNSLKSPDSDEHIQGNPSFFAWFCLDLFGRNSRVGCMCPPRAGAVAVDAAMRRSRPGWAVATRGLDDAAFAEGRLPTGAHV